MKIVRPHGIKLQNPLLSTLSPGTTFMFPTDSKRDLQMVILDSDGGENVILNLATSHISGTVCDNDGPVMVVAATVVIDYEEEKKP